MSRSSPLALLLALALAPLAQAEELIPAGTQTVAAPWGGFGEARPQGEEPIPDNDGRFSIVFDYRFDEAGYFDNPVARANLEMAASIWSAGIKDDFPTVRAGTPLLIMNPRTLIEETLTLEYDIDDMVIFVATSTLIEGEMAKAGPITRWYRRLNDEYPLGARERIEGDDFQPWAGFLSINPEGSPPLFLDETPGTDDDIPRNTQRRYDFLTLALHELGHILGIGTADVFFAKSGIQSADGLQTKTTSDGRLLLFYDAYRVFYGPASRRVNDGQPVLLSQDQGHIRTRFVVGGNQDLMDEDLNPTRQLPTGLDWALLKDIGYEVSLLE